MQTEFSQNIGPTCDGGPTFEHGPSQTQSGLTLSAEGFLAKTSACQTRTGKDWTGNIVDCGESSPESSENFDQDLRLLKTSQLRNGERCRQFSKTLPTWGTMRNGVIYPRSRWVPHIDESDCLLLPTPTASQDYKPIRRLAPSEANKTHGTLLPGAIGHLFPLLVGRFIHPLLSEQLMGFPPGWTDCDVLETP